MRVTGIRNLGYVYEVITATKEEAVELAEKEYRAETGDIVLRIEEVSAEGVITAPPKKKKRVKAKRH
jgi:hypothetical protein